MSLAVSDMTLFCLVTWDMRDALWQTGSHSVDQLCITNSDAAAAAQTDDSSVS